MATAFFNTKIETSNSPRTYNSYILSEVISTDSKESKFSYTIIQSPGDVILGDNSLRVGYESNGTLIIEVSADRFLANATTEIEIGIGRKASALKESSSFVNGMQYTKDNWLSIISNNQDKVDPKK